MNRKTTQNKQTEQSQTEHKMTYKEIVKFIKWLEDRTKHVELENAQVQKGLKTLREELDGIRKFI